MPSKAIVSAQLGAAPAGAHGARAPVHMPAFQQSRLRLLVTCYKCSYCQSACTHTVKEAPTGRVPTAISACNYAWAAAAACRSAAAAFSVHACGLVLAFLALYINNRFLSAPASLSSILSSESAALCLRWRVPRWRRASQSVSACVRHAPGGCKPPLTRREAGRRAPSRTPVLRLPRRPPWAGYGTRSRATLRAGWPSRSCAPRSEWRQWRRRRLRVPPAGAIAAPGVLLVAAFLLADANHVHASAVLTTSRSLGQNFMLDDSVLAAIVEAAGIEPGDLVLEIGPGGCWAGLKGVSGGCIDDTRCVHGHGQEYEHGMRQAYLPCGCSPAPPCTAMPLCHRHRQPDAAPAGGGGAGDGCREGLRSERPVGGRVRPGEGRASHDSPAWLMRRRGPMQGSRAANAA